MATSYEDEQKEVFQSMVVDSIETIIDELETYEDARETLFNILSNPKEYDSTTRDELLDYLIELIKRKFPNLAQESKEFKELKVFYTAQWQLIEFHSGRHDFATTFGKTAPHISQIRIWLYEIIMETLRKKFPKETLNFLTLPTLSSDLKGMKKIRELFRQYMELTSDDPYFFQRYMIALRVLREKELLGIEGRLSSEDNILKEATFAPGDFSNLDLSHLTLKRTNGGKFPNLDLHGSNFAFSSFDGFEIQGNFDKCTLNGTNFSAVLYLGGTSTFLGADVKGAYFGDWYSQESHSINLFNRAKNVEKVSYTLEEYQRFLKTETIKLPLYKTIDLLCSKIVAFFVLLLAMLLYRYQYNG